MTTLMSSEQMFHAALAQTSPLERIAMLHKVIELQQDVWWVRANIKLAEHHLEGWELESLATVCRRVIGSHVAGVEIERAIATCLLAAGTSWSESSLTQNALRAAVATCADAGYYKYAAWAAIEVGQHLWQHESAEAGRACLHEAVRLATLARESPVGDLGIGSAWLALARAETTAGNADFALAAIAQGLEELPLPQPKRRDLEKLQAKILAARV